MEISLRMSSVQNFGCPNIRRTSLNVDYGTIFESLLPQFLASSILTRLLMIIFCSCFCFDMILYSILIFYQFCEVFFEIFLPDVLDSKEFFDIFKIRSLSIIDLKLVRMIVVYRGKGVVETDNQYV